MALCQYLLIEDTILLINPLNGDKDKQPATQLFETFQLASMTQTEPHTDRLLTSLLYLFSYSVPEENVLRASKTEILRGKKREREQKCPVLRKKES